MAGDVRIIKSFSPDGIYARHSEGAFLRLKDGGILFVYSRFLGENPSDDAPSTLAAMRSYDEGETWTDAVEIVNPAKYNTKNVMSVSLMRMLDGELGLFYIVKQDAGWNRIILARSRDEGETYYSEVDCTPAHFDGYYVLNNDRVERLASGRLLMPLTLHRGSYNTEIGARLEGRSFGYFTYSDDDGATWKTAADIVFPPFTGTSSGLQECGAIEVRPGLIKAYWRTDRMYQYEAFSLDDGDHWTEAQPSRFTAPCSPMKIAKSPINGRFYAVWNPIPNYNGRELHRAGWGRTPIVWAELNADASNFSKTNVIEGEPDHGYCYPALFFTKDGQLLIAYCSGGPEDHNCCLAKLTLTKVEI